VSTTSATVNGYTIPPSLTGQQQQRQQPRRQQQQWDEPPGSPLSPNQQQQQQQQSGGDLLSPKSYQGSDPLAEAGFSGRGLGVSGSGRHVFGTSPCSCDNRYQMSLVKGPVHLQPNLDASLQNKIR